jgi:hypothetical protein
VGLPDGDARDTAHADCIGCCSRQIDAAALDKRAAIRDPNFYRPIIGFITVTWLPKRVVRCAAARA